MITGNPTWRAHSMASPSLARMPSEPGRMGTPARLHRGAGFFLFAHQAGDFGRRSDELDVAGFGDFGEVGVFRQQAVAGMDGVHVGDFRRADHRRDIEITLRQLRRADANGFVGEADVQRIAVGLAVNRDRADAQLLAGADHPQGNLSAIGDQDFLEHALDCVRNFYHGGTETQRKAKMQKIHPQTMCDRCWTVSIERLFRPSVSLCLSGEGGCPHDYFRGLMANSSCPYSIGALFATSLFTISPATSDSISFINFMASTMHRICPASTMSPGFTNGGDPGEGDS